MTEKTLTATATAEGAAAHVHGICLKTGPPRRIGVELEWLVRDLRDPSLPVSAERIAAAVAGFGVVPGLGTGNGDAPGVASLPRGSSLTAEPGGQLELSSLPAPSLAACVTATAADLAAMREATARVGLELAGFGLDPVRSPRRILRKPRYAAMEAFFDRGGSWGRQMMCSSASVQVCVDAGDSSDTAVGFRWRWRLAHAIGPVLVAAFANSPSREGKPTGWRSTRQQVWSHLDPGRTRPPAANGDPRAAWAAYALDAEVMCVPGPGTWTAPEGLTFRRWLASGIPRPVRDTDLDYHLTTLFPPVRPRGHLELRMIDAQPGDGWIVPLAVTVALFDDAEASRAAMAATSRLSGHAYPWEVAARLGPADPILARASHECFGAAIEALARLDAPTAIRDAVGEFNERYVLKHRCPADDLLEEIT